MSPEAIEVLLRLAPILLSLGAGAWALYVYRAGARKEEIDKLNARIDTLNEELDQHKEDSTESRVDLRERLVKVEEWLKDVPDKEAVHQLALSVSEIKGDMKAQGESLTAVRRSVQRTEDFLMQPGKTR